MALPAVERTKRSVTLTKAGQTGPWMQQEVRSFATQVLVEENRKEANLTPPNRPSTLVVNKRGYSLSESESKTLAVAQTGGVVITGKWSKLSLLYSSVADLAQATAAVYAELLKLTRRKSGTGFRSYYFWLNDKDNKGRSTRAESITAVKAWLDQSRGSRVSVHILGPTVVYRRKLIYNPAGQATFKRSDARGLKKTFRASNSRLKGLTLDRIIGYNTEPESRGFRVRVAGKKRPKEIVEFDVRQALQRIAIRRAKAKFPSVWFGYGYVPSREALPPDKRTGKKYGQGPGQGNIAAIFIAATLRRRG